MRLEPVPAARAAAVAETLLPPPVAVIEPPSRPLAPAAEPPRPAATIEPAARPPFAAADVLRQRLEEIYSFQGDQPVVATETSARQQAREVAARRSTSEEISEPVAPPAPGAGLSIRDASAPVLPEIEPEAPGDLTGQAEERFSEGISSAFRHSPRSAGEPEV
jgi:hypothetical protein